MRARIRRQPVVEYAYDEDGELVECRPLAPGEFAKHMKRILENSITNKADAAWELIQRKIKISNLEEELAEALAKIKNLEAENNYLASKKIQMGLEVEHLAAQLDRERGH